MFKRACLFALLAAAVLSSTPAAARNDDDEELPARGATQSAVSTPRVWFSVSGGLASGPIAGTLEVRKDLGSSYRGLSADMIGVVELGVALDPHVALAVRGRAQEIENPSSKYGDRVPYSARALLGRVIYIFNPGSPLRAYAAGALGMGSFRLTIVPDQSLSDMHDAVRGGGVIFGAGGGLMLEPWKAGGFVLDANLLLGAPDVAAVLDITAGIYVRFGSVRS